jgi:predicted Fe-Mo cluster-binding NifX family protein
MRVCVPTTGERGLEEMVGEHFNKAQTFTIVDTEKNSTENIRCLGDEWCPMTAMAEKNVDVLVCSHLGHTALSTLEELGISVYIGAYGRVKDAIRMWRSDMLHEATDKKIKKKSGTR